MSKKTGRVDARRTTLEVLELLRSRSSEKNPIRKQEIVQLLEDRAQARGLNIAANRDTVKQILQDLQAVYPENIFCSSTDQRDDREYTFRWWYAEPFSLKETELLIDDTTKENIRFLRSVIQKNSNDTRKETTVSFDLRVYHCDQELHPIKDRPIKDVLPLRICAAYGHYYLVGLFPGRSSFAHFRIDLMSGLKDTKRAKSDDSDRKYAKSRMSLEETRGYIQAHPYMFYEKEGELPRHVQLRVDKNYFTQVHDVFGEWDVLNKGESTADIEVTCNPDGVLPFVLQYLGCVSVLGPEDVKERVEEELKEKWTNCQKLRGPEK